MSSLSVIVCGTLTPTAVFPAWAGFVGGTLVFLSSNSRRKTGLWAKKNRRPQARRRCLATSSGNDAARAGVRYRTASGRLDVAAALEAGLADIGVDIVLGHIGLAGVAVGRADETLGELVEIHLLHRQEALQIGLLVGGEVDVAGLDEVQRLREQVEAGNRAAGFHQAVFVGHETAGIGVGAAGAEQAVDGLVAEIIALDARDFGCRIRARVDDIVGDAAAVVLDRLDVAVETRLRVQR